jgi:hypothetical protein
MTNRQRKAAPHGLRTRAALVSLALGMAAAASSGLAFADEDEVRNCVGLSEIDRTEIVDDRTILFRMHDGTIYRNVLGHECPTLKNRDQFSYKVPSTRLCSMDLITVLEQRGVGFGPGPSCPLGSFEPISADEAQLLLDSAAR